MFCLANQQVTRPGSDHSSFNSRLEQIIEVARLSVSKLKIAPIETIRIFRPVSNEKGPARDRALPETAMLVGQLRLT